MKKKGVKNIETFFVVTKTSVYQAVTTNKGPYLKKIGRFRASRLPVGSVISNGDMIGITKEQAILYNTDEHKNPACMVNTRYYGGGTSGIVAIFLNRKEAIRCAEECAKMEFAPAAWSQEWSAKTLEALAKIVSGCDFCRIDTGIPSQIFPEA